MTLHNIEEILSGNHPTQPLCTDNPTFAVLEIKKNLTKYAKIPRLLHILKSYK